MDSEKAFLDSYNIESYDRPSVATDIVAFTISSKNTESFRKDPDIKLSVLLIERAEYPFKGAWALPGGFVRIDETVEQSALREIVEETGVNPDTLVHTGVFSEINRDPRGRVISNAFTCIFNSQPTPIAGSDAKSALWFDVSFKQLDETRYTLELTNEDKSLVVNITQTKSPLGIKQLVVDSSVLAFDHAQIIFTALKALKSKAIRFELIFDFLPEEFTLAGLQKIHQTITGTSTSPANFRRKVLDYVEETGNSTQGAGHRPAMLYRKKVRF